jgi:carboxyl-terminal processing protease
MKDGIGYIALTEGFSYTTATEFAAALGRLKRSGVQALVLDLRGNGGGLMETGDQDRGTFLPAGRVIVSERGRTRAEDREWRSRNLHPETMPTDCFGRRKHRIGVGDICRGNAG